MSMMSLFVQSPRDWYLESIRQEKGTSGRTDSASKGIEGGTIWEGLGNHEEMSEGDSVSVMEDWKMDQWLWSDCGKWDSEVRA